MDTFGLAEKVRPNGKKESLNGKFRDECLNENTFDSLSEAREEIEHWRIGYNASRPHRALGQQTPEEFARLLENTTLLPRKVAELLGTRQKSNQEGRASRSAAFVLMRVLRSTLNEVSKNW